MKLNIQVDYNPLNNIQLIHNGDCLITKMLKLRSEVTKLIHKIWMLVSPYAIIKTHENWYICRADLAEQFSLNTQRRLSYDQSV